MNIEFAFREENGVVILKVTSPDKPVVIETATTNQKENASPVTEAVTPNEALKAEATALSEKVATLNRKYERLKKAAYRAGKRLEENLKGLGQNVTAASNYCPEIATAGCPASVPRVPEAGPQTVPGDNAGQANTNSTYHTNYINCNTNTYTNSFTNSVSTKTDHVTSQTPEGTNNCPPFAPEDAHTFIPLAKLPEVYQKVLTAWNDLPLPEKLKGLYPDVRQKLHKLLKEYGEAAVQKAIRMVADSPFLLGKVNNTKGWQHIYFGWLLNPANLKKILENKYRDRSQEYECAAYPEYIPWTEAKDGFAATVTNPVQEECSDYNTALPCYLDPDYMLQGLGPLTDHARSCLAEAANMLGLTKASAA